MEEEEACHVDPDLALSYIDEKIQDVLGHFQKDFEDGVSSEILGSKFGGYGSFLPTCQRSPCWSHTRTPPKAHNINKPNSPENILLKGSQRTSLASSFTVHSGTALASSAYSAIVSALKAPAANGKTKSALPPAQDEDSTCKSEIVKKPTYLLDQKAPKLHNRDGIESLSTQKKAEIYSGLGLDVSPSSSLEDSPISSERLSNDIQDSRYESPTSILQIMTSFPIYDGLLLSPLADDLIFLSGQGKCWTQCGSECVQDNLETSIELMSGTHNANREASEARKWKLYNKDVLADGWGYGNQYSRGVQSKEEIDAVFITCEEVVSKASKLSHLSNPYHNIADAPKGAGMITDCPRKSDSGRVTEALFNCSSNKNLEPVISVEIDTVERPDNVQSREIVKDVFMADSSVESETKKSFNRDTVLSKNDLGSRKKNCAEDRYRDFFGDIGAEEDDAETGLRTTHSPEVLKDSDVVVNRKFIEHKISMKERVNGRKTEKPCASRECPILASNGPTPADGLHATQDSQNLGVQAISGGQKRYGLEVWSNATKQDGTQSSNYIITKHQEDPNSRTSSGTNSLDDSCRQHSGLPNSSAVEKKKHKNEKKKKFLDDSSDGGTQIAKIRSISEVDLDASSKNIKQVVAHDDENQTSGPKPGRSSSGGMSRCALGNIQDNHKNSESKDDSKKNVFSTKNSVSLISDLSVQLDKCDNKDSLTKRKGSKLRDNGTCNPQDFVKETCDDSFRKEKRARVSKSDRNDSSASLGSGGSVETGQFKKEQLVGQDPDSTLSLQSVIAAHATKKDLCNSQPSVTATPIASKVSGSHIDKTSLQEVRRSPIESVSSSPLRISNMDSGANLGRNDNCKNASSFLSASFKRFTDGENNGFSILSGMVKKDKSCDGQNNDSEISEVDFKENNIHHQSGTEVKANTKGSSYAVHQCADINADPLCQSSQYVCKTGNSDQRFDNERKNEHHCQNSRSVSTNGKGFLSQNKGRNQFSKSDSDQCETKDPDILNLSSNQIPLDEERLKPGSNRFEGRSDVVLDRFKKSAEKDISGNILDKNVEGGSESRFDHHGDADLGLDGISQQDTMQAAASDRDGQRSSKKFVSNKSELIGVSPSSPLTRNQNEVVVFKGPVPGSERENGANLLIIDAFGREKSNASTQGRNAKSYLGNWLNSTAHNVRDRDTLSSVRKDSISQAAVKAIKEATNLKHLADRLKNSGSSESTGIYFQAALKFLQGASLLEYDNTKYGEMSQSRRIYSSTAKLCQFCAHEYEKLKEMAAAALAYKCMEVAYMRVIYSSQTDANRYRNELQTALEIFPPGVDKAALAKVVGTHDVSAKNSSSAVQLINLAQEVNFAMEASRKSRVAFAAANPRYGDTNSKDCMLSVKKALDFNFQDVDGLLRLVRVAMEAISH